MMKMLNYIGLLVKYLILLSVFDKTWILSTDFEKYSNMKIHSSCLHRASMIIKHFIIQLMHYI